jgi:hypothetical protein
MRLSSLAITAAVSLLFITACNHQPDCPDCTDVDCTQDYTIAANNTDTLFPFDPCAATSYEYPGPYFYIDGCFNPSNENQLAFVRVNLKVIPYRFELCTFDFCSGQFQVLTDKAFSNPDWSVKDWIVFRGRNAQIWKIKSNGDSLIQLTNLNDNFTSPKWDATGNGFLVSSWTDVIICDENGIFIDSFDHPKKHFDWDGQKIVYVFPNNPNRSDDLYISYLSSQMIEQIDESPLDPTGDDGFIQSVALNPAQGEVVWTGTRRVCITDFLGNRLQIATIFNNNWYEKVAVSGDGKKLVLGRIDRRRIAQCVIEERYNLYLMEYDGSNERKIIFPE